MNKLVSKVGDMMVVTSGIQTRPGNYLTLILRGDVLFDVAACEGDDDDAKKQHEAYTLSVQIFGPLSESINRGEITTAEEVYAAVDIQEARLTGKPTLLH